MGDESLDYVTVCTATTQPEADLVESVLRAAEINFVHDHEYATTSGFANTSGIHISVQKADAERALAALEELAAGDEEQSASDA